MKTQVELSKHLNIFYLLTAILRKGDLLHTNLYLPPHGKILLIKIKSLATPHA